MSMDATKYKPYPAYKESGVEWLGGVPAHWAVKRLSWLFELISSGTTPPSDDQSNYGGDIPWVTTGELREETILDTEKKLTELALKKYSALKIYPPRTLLIALYGATIGRLGVLGISACTNQACCALVDPISVSSNFTFYVLYAAKRYLLLISSGGGQPNINQDKIRSLRIAVPPVEEQHSIATFLDCETAKIDTLIAKQERLIELLGEKRTALISHAVTKGLNPDAPMKDSGVEWLGEVPAHWVNTPIKHTLFGLIDTEHKTAPFFENGEYFVVRTTNIKNGKIIFDGAKYTDEAGYIEWTRRGKPSPGDIIFTREAPAGQACLVPGDLPICIGQRTVLMRVNYSLLESRFGLWSLYGGLASDFITQLSQGSTVVHFNISDIGNIPIMLPTLSEQKEISDFLDRETAKIDSLITKARRAIDLLKERRTALISAAVTGKIDVREVFPSLTPE